jgi:AcrR family transcriptional regulator
VTARKKRTQAERTELSDRKMLEAATALILEQGTEKTTLKEVGLRAGYSRGLASVRFGSKDGLFVRLEQLHRQIWAEKLRLLTKNKAGADFILARIDVIQEIIASEENNIKAIYTLWFDAVGQKSLLHELLVKFNRDARLATARLVEAAIESGEISANIDPHAFALNHFSQIFGLIYQWIVAPDEIDIHKGLESIKENARLVLIGEKSAS